MLNNHSNSFKSHGSLLLLYDGGDGVRLLRTDNTGQKVLAEVQEGAAGDVGIAMAIDPAGDIYVAGTSLSGVLAGTAGAAFPQVQDISTNSFLAKFDPQLHLQFLTFLGAGKTAVTGVSATADAAFVTGTNFGSSFPTTTGAVLQRAAPGSSVNGFVERFTVDGSALAYSTLLTGANGDSECLGIVADANDDAYVVGETSATSFPTVAALVSIMPGSTAGFVLKLTPAGDAFVFSSFVPGSGLTGVDLDPSGNSLLLTGNVSPGQFPVANVSGPIANAPYVSLLRWSADGAKVLGSTLLAPGTSSQVTSAPDGTAWVSGSLALPLFAPGRLGDSFFAHVNAQALADVTGRTGGMTVTNAGFATLVGALGAPAINAAGTSVALPGTLAASVETAPLLPRFDVSLTAAPNELLPDLPLNLLPSTCAGRSQCLGSAGLLTVLSVSGDGSSLPAVSVAPAPLFLSASEFDFGIVTASSPASRMVTIANVSASSQSFKSAGDGLASAPPYTLAETASTCDGIPGSHTLPAGGACTITLSLAASTTAADDGIVNASWQIAGQDITVTGITQSADLSVSSAVIDFGSSFATSATASLPRYLYLSNSSAFAIAHTPVPAATNGPFTVLDECPSTLEPQSVCRFTLTYAPVLAPSVDSMTLDLDGGLNVLVTGVFLSGSAPATGLPQSPIRAMPTSVTFVDSVTLTELSASPQVVTLTNTSAGPVPVAIQAAGDFAFSNPCGPILSASASCEITVQFSPSQPGPRNGLLSISTGSGTADLNVSLSGSAAPLLPPNNGTLALASTPIGEPVFAWYKVSAALDSLTVSASGAGFRAALVEDDGNGQGTLPASAFAPALTHSCRNCWLGLVLVPQAAGVQTGMLTLSSTSGGRPYQLLLTGSGTALQGLVVTPAQADLGTVAVGSTSAPLVLTLANLLNPDTAVSILSITAAGDFQVSAGADGTPCAGLLNATAACRFAVTFSPITVGQRFGAVIVQTSGGVVSVPLSGSSVAGLGLNISPTALNFDTASMAGGDGGTQQSTQLTNTTGGTLAISAISSTDASFVPSSSCGNLQSGATCTITVNFLPGGSEAAGSLNFTATAGVGSETSPVPFSIPLSGSYTANETGLVLLPADANFGAQAVGLLGQIREFTLFNTSAVAQTIAVNPPQNYPLAAPFACTTLPAGASCTFSLGFLPEVGGALTGSVLATGTTASGASSQAIGYLLGYGNAAAHLTLSGDALIEGAVDFGQVISGASLQHTLTLTNSGNGPLNLRRISTGPPFQALTTCAVTLMPGESCQISVTYSPLYAAVSSLASTLPRTDSETLTIASDAASSMDEVDLTGSALPGGGGSSSPLASYTLSAGALTFPNTVAGAASPNQDILVLNTGTAPLAFAAIASPADFAVSSICAQLPPGATCIISVSFRPATSTGNAVRSATLAIQSNALDALEYVSLLGQSTTNPLSVSNANLNFGSLPVGDTASLQLSVTNLTTLPISLGTITAIGDYSVQLGSCPAPGNPLPAGQTCTMLVEFAPTAAVARSGLLSLPSDALDTPLQVALAGVGTAPKVELSPTFLNFGTHQVDTHTQLPLGLTNGGTAPLAGVAATISGPGASDFSVDATCKSTAVAPSAGCTLKVSFSPTLAGARIATLTLASNDPSGPVTVPLSGTGTPAAGLDVTVNGASNTTLEVKQSATASFIFAVTPLGGFQGPVSLSCTSPSPGPYAVCSLLEGTMTLSDATDGSTGSITTLGPLRSSGFALASLLGVSLLLFRRRSSRFGQSTALVAFALVLMLSSVVGCGGPGSTGSPLTPRGTYQYTVTATATGKAPLSASATITLVVQ